MTLEYTSLADDLRAALEGTLKIEGDEVTTVDGAADPAADEVEEVAEDPAPEAADDELGADNAEPDQSDDEAGNEAAEDAGAPEPAVAAPEHWNADDRAFFESLPDDAARTRVLDWRKSLERGVEDKWQQAASVRREVEEIDRMLAPFAAQMQMAGLDRAAVTRGVFGLWAALQTDPANSLAGLAEQYGRGVAGQPQAHDLVRRIATALKVEVGGPQAQADQDPMAAQVRALQAKLDEFERAQQQAKAQATASAVARAEAQFREFVEAKDEQGTPRFPHVDKVRGAMAGLMSSGAASTLEDAYARAVWADPALREQQLKAERAAAEKAAAAARRAKVARAQAAHTPRTASAPAKADADDDVPSGESVGDTLRRVYQETASARV